MNIEVVKFYEVSRNDVRGHLLGTLHIKLAELGLNIKGIHVMRKKNYWFFGLPNRKGFDKSKGEEVTYAVVLFDEKAKNEELINIIRQKGREFVEDYLKSNLHLPEDQNLADRPKSTGC